MDIAAFYLVLSSYKGGMTTVPFPDYKSCIHAADDFMRHHYASDKSATCLSTDSNNSIEVQVPKKISNSVKDALSSGSFNRWKRDGDKFVMELQFDSSEQLYNFANALKDLKNDND